MFRNPVDLIWLAAAVAAGALLVAAGASRRRKVTSLMGDPGTLARLLPPETAFRRRLKAVLELCGLGLLLLALAGPQWGVELVATQGASREVFIAVDTSLSMLTEDVKPSRLEKAKQELSLLLDSLRGDRVGVIAFAGEAAVICPLTSDIDAAKQLLRSIDTGTIPVPGTGIGKAIRLATASLSRYPGIKTLVLLSDGEDHKTDPLGAAEEAAAAGVKIYSVGIGTSEGEPIPLKDASGTLTGYKKDKKGATVISKLSESTLTQVAAKADGQYFRLSPSQNEAGEIADRIEKSEKSDGPGGTTNSYQNRFMIPLSLAFILLLLEMVIPDRGPLRPWGPRRGTSEKKSAAAITAAAFILLFMIPSRLWSATEEGSLRKGNRLYQQEQYVPALEAYSAAGERSPNDPRPVFNAGDALFRLNELDKAGEAFESIGKSQGPVPIREAAYYNLGNAHLGAGRYPEAISDYRRAVSLNPNDKDAIYNLAVALSYLKHPPPKKKNDKKNPPPPQNKPDDKKDKGGGGEKPQDDKGGGQPPPQAKTRPQDQISREDAQRIMRAVAEKEKSGGGGPRQFQKAPIKKQDVEEDSVSAALICLLSAFVRLGWSQLSISADVDKTEVAIGDQIVLGVTVTGPEASLPDPEIPSLPSFSIYSSGRNQNITFVNGRVSSSITFTYVLEPRAAGRGVIPPITISYKGQQAKTNPIEIHVSQQGAAAPASPAAQPQAGPPGAPRQAPQPGPPSQPQGRKAAVGGSPVFVKAQVDKTSAYVNEQLTLTVRFYTAVSLLGMPQYSAPKTDGFLAEDLPPERHGNTDISGRNYYFSEIKTALFPAQAGRLTVGPAAVRVQIQQNMAIDPTAADFFERFMSGALVNAVTRDLASEPLIVNAQALPEAGKPQNFSGAVGNFRISAAVDRSSVKVGDAVNLTVTVSGEGNIKAIGDPQMPDLTNFRVYDTVTSLNLDKKDDKVQGSKVFRTVLVPRVSGDLAIPPVSFSYFDPAKKAYMKAESLPLTVKSAPSPGGPAVAAGNPAAGAVAPLGVTTVSEDIRYLKTGGARPFSRLLEAVAGAGPLNAAPILAFAFCLGLVQYRKLGASDPAGTRFRGAAKTAMAKINQSLRASDPGKAAGLMADAFTKYLADKLGQPASGLTLRGVLELLAARQPPVDPALAEQVKELWDELDMRRFSPNAPGGGAPLAESLRTLLEALEKELKR